MRLTCPALAVAGLLTVGLLGRLPAGRTAVQADETPGSAVRRAAGQRSAAGEGPRAFALGGAADTSAAEMAAALAGTRRRPAGVIQQADGQRYVWAHPGDFERDGVLDARDVAGFRTVWLAGSGPADFNGDGRVDGLDMAAFMEGFDRGEWQRVYIC